MTVYSAEAISRILIKVWDYNKVFNIGKLKNFWQSKRSNFVRPLKKDKI